MTNYPPAWPSPPAGPPFEAALAATGAFSYRQPDVLGVPVWLPALYLHLSLFTRQIHLGFQRQLLA